MQNWYCLSNYLLKVNVIPRFHRQRVWHEVILNGWVNLHDVSTLSTHVQIENVLSLQFCRAFAYFEYVTPANIERFKLEKLYLLYGYKIYHTQL